MFPCEILLLALPRRMLLLALDDSEHFCINAYFIGMFYASCAPLLIEGYSSQIQQ